MKQRIKTIKIIHLALSAGVILAYLLMGDFNNILNVEIDTSFLIYSFIPAIAIISGNMIFKHTMKRIKKESTTDQKFAIYQTASIYKWAILEGASFLILFSKPSYTILGVLILFYLIVIAPKDDAIYQLLKIKKPNL